MSTPSIHGWVEVRSRSPGEWEGVVQIDPLVSGYPHDGVYECLFWRDVGELGFEPIAPRRGLPPDISREVQETLTNRDWGDLTHRSWVTWAEMQAMDWDEVSPNPESGTHPQVYERDADGQLVHVGEALDKPTFPGYPERCPDIYEEHGKVYRYERLTRRQVFAMSYGWPTLLRIMTALGKHFGPERVRLVAFFSWDQKMRQEDDDERYAQNVAADSTGT